MLLSRVIRNFLANAIRYTAAGRVLLGCRRRGKVVRIEICDSGIGIPESATQQVFEEFRQLSTSGEARGKGVGLGLAIVRRLSRVLGHPISVRSKVGRGSAFFVDVPIGSLHDAHGTIQTARRTPVHALASAFIVIIEDHDAVRDGMRELLQSWGCRTITAADRHRALGELAQAGRPPDMVIADYHLDRGSTGLAAVAAVRAVHGPVPALIITADRSREVLDEIRHHGIHSLQKPVRPAKLRALVSHLLAQRRPGKAEAIAAAERSAGIVKA